jgi:competence protein ComFB
MAFRDVYDFQFLVNGAEDLVLRELERQLAQYEDSVCRCNDCVVDMAAIALNAVKPNYRSSLLGECYAQGELPFEYLSEIQKAVNMAINKVYKNPSHDPLPEPAAVEEYR